MTVSEGRTRGPRKSGREAQGAQGQSRHTSQNQGHRSPSRRPGCFEKAGKRNLDKPSHLVKDGARCLSIDVYVATGGEDGKEVM